MIDSGGNMGFRENISKKLSSSYSDRTELNRLVLRWKKSFDEVDKILNGGKKKSK